MFFGQSINPIVPRREMPLSKDGPSPAGDLRPVEGGRPFSCIASKPIRSPNSPEVRQASSTASVMITGKLVRQYSANLVGDATRFTGLWRRSLKVGSAALR